MTTPLSFVPVGFGNAICANRIMAILFPAAAAARRRQKLAKQQDRFLDLTFGRSLKCLLLLDDGTQVGCGLTNRTILSRLARPEEAEADAEADENENNTEKKDG